MTTELERRLGEVLHHHAEEAMESIDTQSRLETLERVVERDSGRRRLMRRAGVLALAACVAGAAFLVGTSDDASRTPSPTGQPGTSTSQVATDFLAAFTAYDAAQVQTYLAPGAHLTIWSAPRDIDWMTRQSRWLRATGFTAVPGPCTTRGMTTVVCTFDYHGFGSQQLRRGPFTDTMVLTVEEGHVLDGILTTTGGPDGFASQMWRPFARWLATSHPSDAAMMYADWPSMNRAALGDRATRTWVRMLGRYQDAVERGRAD